MKAIKTQSILTGITAKVDGSLSLRFTTPELTSQEKAAVMDLQNVNNTLTIRPSDSANLDLTEVRAELGVKTPSQRLRGVLFVRWEQEGRPGTFEVFYYQAMEKIIDRQKSFLD
jgi:hypothetical protein